MGDMVVLAKSHARGIIFLMDHQETPLFLASRRGKLEAARLLLESGADVNSQDSLGRAPLHVAAENGHFDIVRLLLDHDPDVSAQARSLRTPLDLKAERRRLHIERHGDAELDPRDGMDWTPLHCAANQGMFEVAKVLLERGAEVDAQDKQARTPLYFAAQQGHLELVRLLLKHHADVLAVDREDHTFLDAAWTNGHKKIFDIDTRYEGGQTALHIAAQHGDTELMSWLIQHESNPIDPNVEDEDQETPLFPASRNGILDATSLLLDEKAEVDHRDWQKMTPLHWVSELHDAVARLLIERNAEVDAKHINDWTPLHFASLAGHGGVAKELLHKNARVVNAQNDSGWTPLHMASQEGHLDVVNLLLAHLTDVDIPNKAGETALHLAAYYAHLDVARALLNRKANPQIENLNGEMPSTLISKVGKTLLELASENGDNETAGILKLAGLGRAEQGKILVGEPVVEGQDEEQQVSERVKIPE